MRRYIHAMKKFLLLLCVIGPMDLMAQGCSDAGVCTAGAIGQLHLWQDSVPDAGIYRSTARVTYSYAVGEQKTTIMQMIPELNIGIGERLGLQVKLPYASSSGNLGEASGLGDAIITASFSFIKEVERSLSGTFGVRLPTGKDNLDVPDPTRPGSERHLPAPYQTGLGTTDLLAGMEWRRGRYVVAVAYQHVLSANNGNTFTADAWSDKPEAFQYFPSAMLGRADDAVVRLQYVYGCGRLALQPGLLAIYHVANDTRLDALNMMDLSFMRTTVQGSQGLTLNGTVDLRYTLSDRWAVEFSAGMPFITRKVRPDGLTREFVLNTGLRYRF